MILVSLNASSDLLSLVRIIGRLGLNILARSQAELAFRFAAKGKDRFDGVSWAMDHVVLGTVGRTGGPAVLPYRTSRDHPRPPQLRPRPTLTAKGAESDTACKTGRVTTVTRQGRTAMRTDRALECQLWGGKLTAIFEACRPEAWPEMRH